MVRDLGLSVSDEGYRPVVRAKGECCNSTAHAALGSRF
jgi:hypothetical protein